MGSILIMKLNYHSVFRLKEIDVNRYGPHVVYEFGFL